MFLRRFSMDGPPDHIVDELALTWRQPAVVVIATVDRYLMPVRLDVVKICRLVFLGCAPAICEGCIINPLHIRLG